MDNSSFIAIEISSIPLLLEDAVSQLCFRFKCLGVSENLSFVQNQLRYDPEILVAQHVHLNAYFSEIPESLFFDQLQAISSQIRWNVREEESRDWMEEWKKTFQPFPLVEKYWVVPSWHQSPTAQEKTISMDPGMAFGTGTHATTQMAAYFIFKHLDSFSKQSLRAIGGKQKASSDLRLLDVGTGTGILLILAHKIGIRHLTGVEVEDQALQVAKDNLAKNAIDGVRLLNKPLSVWSSSETLPFDIIVANIVDGVLIELLPDFVRFLSPEGHLFLTGIIKERDEAFISEFLDRSPFQVHRRFEKEGWVGYWLTKYGLV